MKLEVGDVVLLSSGVYLMTVKEINENNIICTWLNYRDELFEDKFDIKMLVEAKQLFERFYLAPHFTSYDDEEKIRLFGHYSFSFETVSKIKSSNDLKIGDTVKLNSHFTPMCIEEIRDDNVVCVWFNKYGYLKREIFNIEILTVCRFTETTEMEGRNLIKIRT